MKLLLSAMTPGFWLALLLACIVIASGGGIIGYRIASGEAEVAALKVDGERAAERIAHAQQLAAAESDTTAKEKRWQAQLDTIASTHQQEMDHANTKIESLTSDVRSGAVRLSIAVKARPAASNCPASGNPAPAIDDPQESRAELMPEAAATLIGIAADGDDAVRDLNACISAYDALKPQKAAP